MQPKLLFASIVAVAALLTAACGGSPASANPYGGSTDSPAAYSSAAPPASPSSTPVQVANGTVVAVGSTKLGQVLVDGNGRTLYLFAADKGTQSTCNSAACVQYWPPLLTSGAPQAGTGANAALLGTTKRNDGTTEVTYAGHPLYYFLADKKAGDVTGQGVDGFGGPWYVVSPAGAQIS